MKTRKLTDEDRIRKLAVKFGLKVREWNKPGYIVEAAKRAGSVKSLVFEYEDQYSNLNYEIDKNGNCIGFSTDQANSFRKRSK